MVKMTSRSFVLIWLLIASALLLLTSCDDSRDVDDQTDGDGDGGGVEGPVCHAAPLDCPELVCTDELSTLYASTSGALSQCTTIEGDLTVHSQMNTAIEPPRCLRTVTGDLTIQGDPWGDDLSSFQSLEYVGGRLVIGHLWDHGGSWGIKNLDGLSNLREIDEFLTIYGNHNLENVDGLCNMEHAASIGFSDNPSLRDVDGLEKLTHVPRSLVFISDSKGVGHPSLEDLEGLRNLISVGEDLLIGWWFGIYFDSLSDLSGLRSLTHVGRTMYIRNAPLLQDLDGLDALVTIGEGLSISNNERLHDISGLSSFEKGGHLLWITGNAALPDCQATDLVDQLGLHANSTEDNVCIQENLDDGCTVPDWSGDCGGTDYD